MMTNKYIFLLAGLFFISFGFSQKSPATNAKIKTVFIFNFTKYFGWNEVNKSSEFRIGILGADSLIKKELEKLAEIKTVSKLPIKIISFEKVSDVKYTEMLYVDFDKFPDYKINKNFKNTLVITENNPDLSNTMIAFITEGDRQKFAINKINIKHSGVEMNPQMEELAAQVITGADKKADEQKAKEWRSVFDKFADAIKNNSSEITLSKKEAEEVMNTMSEQNQTIKDKELTLSIQQEKISKQVEVLDQQQKDIDLQNKKLITQLGQINSQKTILYLAGFLVLIIAVALFIAYRGNKNKQRANALLSKQKMEIEHQRELVEEKQKEILDSINYARRIQYSLLPSDKLLKENLNNYFLFFKPKDVVSGDFYWGSKVVSPSPPTSSGQAPSEKFILVTADSTGHGVPGAIMSMLNISCLNEAINADKLVQPAEILNSTRKKIIDHLSNDGSTEGGKDGMDCSLVSFDFTNRKLNYSAANNPVWIIRNRTFIALAPDRMPIGKHDKDSILFTQHEVDIESGDMVYTLTDGFPDQFGGPKGKKFKYKQLEELLLSIAHESMENQRKELDRVFEKWKGDLEQVDDVCIIGIRV